MDVVRHPRFHDPEDFSVTATEKSSGSWKTGVVVVALNPALDVTHHVGEVDWSGVNRPREVRVCPGGKGVNVARTLHALGNDTLVTGLAGGVTGDALRAGLAGAGVRADFTAVAGETRRTFAVVDTARGETALFNEPGPVVSRSEWAAFLVTYEKSLAGSSAVVLSGSLPPGLPQDSYAVLAARAAAAGVPAVLDAEGPALLRGAAAGPAIVKPNLAELEHTVGRCLSGPDGADLAAIAGAAGELMAAGARAVVVSLGGDGLFAVTGEGTWRAAPPGRVAGNPIGAGDAVVAGLARGLALGTPWPRRLREAAALGTAAAAAPAAGQFELADYTRALASVQVTGGG
ncbi:MAG TPA: hexose kinase [Streptosporangiaceae bacterium]|nr:hexose kinase [Streptosporangiaceae bacterium]